MVFVEKRISNLVFKYAPDKDGIFIKILKLAIPFGTGPITMLVD